MTRDIGVHGNLFGGIMMGWVDEAASIYACQVCGSSNMVTIKVDEVIFKKKIKVGFVIKIYAEVLQIGRTSVMLGIEAHKRSIYSGEEEVVLSTKTTFVRLDEAGEPTPIASSILERYKHLSKY